MTVPVGLIKGFLIAEYTDPGSGTHALSSREDFDKVRLGYACARCLAEFTTYMAVCPLCGNRRDVEDDLGQTPRMWQEHFDETNRPGEKTVARTADEAIRDLIADADNVEHISLSKLGPRKWGRK